MPPQRPGVPGRREFFYTLLFRERDGFRREDVAEEAWKEHQEAAEAEQPYSFWRTKYEPPAPPAAEPLAKETAEDLLRSYMTEQDERHANARYILALMLERKRLLKQVEAKEDLHGRVLVYEHVKTGRGLRGAGSGPAARPGAGRTGGSRGAAGVGGAHSFRSWSACIRRCAAHIGAILRKGC